MRSRTSIPRGADRHAASSRRGRGQELETSRREHGRSRRAPPCLATRNVTHTQAEAPRGPRPTLEEPFGHERAADERDRGADQLHDLELVAPACSAEPDDSRHGDGGRHRHQTASSKPARAMVPRPAPIREPPPVAPHVGHAGQGGESLQQRLGGIRSRRWAAERTSIEAGNGLSSKPLVSFGQLRRTRAGTASALRLWRRIRGEAAPLRSMSASMRPRCSEVASSRRTRRTRRPTSTAPAAARRSTSPAAAPQAR